MEEDVEREVIKVKEYPPMTLAFQENVAKICGVSVETARRALVLSLPLLHVEDD